MISYLKLFLFCALFVLKIVHSARVYIDINSTASSPDGSSWSSAFTSIQDAIDSFSSSANQNSLWIAQGHYFASSSISRDACYSFAKRIFIYGGFTGSESSVDDRPYPLAETIIDGDIGTIGDATDNCYHIIYLEGDDARGSTFNGVTFQNGYAVYDGDGSNYEGYGGVLTTYPHLFMSVTFDNCSFINNTALQGGVLHITEQSTARFNYCIFEGNRALKGLYLGGYGGCIYGTWAAEVNVTGSQFIENNATYRGGAMYGDYGSIYYVTDTEFISNTASFGHGGAIFMEDRNSQTDGTFITVSNSKFTSNSALKYGGACCWFNGPFITLDNTIFDSNTAALGGALANYDDITYLSFTSNTFTSNTATEDSAYDDIYNDSIVSLEELSETDLISNINITYYLHQLYDNREVTAEYNTDRDEDSTICYVDGSNSCSGSQCNSRDGSSWSKCYIDIQDCIDSIGTGGGEIWVAEGTYTPTTYADWAKETGPKYWSFVLNEGIAMYGGFDGSESERSERNWRDNPTYLSCSNVATNKDCSILMIAEMDCIIDGFIFTGSRDPTANRRRNRRRRRLSDDEDYNVDSDFDFEAQSRRHMQGVYSTSIAEILASTSLGRGGGIYSNGTNIVVANSIFSDIQATKGGGIYCIGYSGINMTEAPTVINAVFIGNTAERGAAYTADAYCDLSCSHCAFLYNRCTEKGGAIYLDFDCDVSMNDTIFIGNEAWEAGGCIAADGGSEVYMIDAEMYDNYANWEAGCLYSGSHGSGAIQGYWLTNPTFDENNAPYGFDDVWLWMGDTISIENLPTNSPTLKPTNGPTGPTAAPVVVPTLNPTQATKEPTKAPADPGNGNSDSDSDSGGNSGGDTDDGLSKSIFFLNNLVIFGAIFCFVLCF